MTTHAPASLTISLPNVMVRRPAKRGAEYCLTLGRFVGRGTTLAAAKADLAAQIILAVDSLNTEPAFARDDDGSLIIALDRPWGIDTYRATDTTARLITTSDRHPQGPAADVARTHHYRLLPTYGRADH